MLKFNCIGPVRSTGLPSQGRDENNFLVLSSFTKNMDNFFMIKVVLWVGQCAVVSGMCGKV